MTLNAKTPTKRRNPLGPSPVVGTRLVEGASNAQVVDGERIVVCVPLGKAGAPG